MLALQRARLHILELLVVVIRSIRERSPPFRDAVMAEIDMRLGPWGLSLLDQVWVV